MNNPITTYQENLPDTIEDLSKFVLVGREKLNSVRAEIRAIDKVHLAREVHEQKKAELNLLSAAMMDAEVKLGELIKKIPKASKGNQYTGKMVSDSAVDNQKPKHEVIAELGFSTKQAERFETLADHKKIVEIEKYRAKEEDRPVTREKALKATRFVKQLPEEKRQEIESLPIEQAAAKLEELYVNQLEQDVAIGIDLDIKLNDLYEVSFTKERIKGYADGCVQDWEEELNRLDALIKNLIQLRKALEERSRL